MPIRLRNLLLLVDTLSQPRIQRQRQISQIQLRPDERDQRRPLPRPQTLTLTLTLTLTPRLHLLRIDAQIQLPNLAHQRPLRAQPLQRRRERAGQDDAVLRQEHGTRVGGKGSRAQGFEERGGRRGAGAVVVVVVRVQRVVVRGAFAQDAVVDVQACGLAGGVARDEGRAGEDLVAEFGGEGGEGGEGGREGGGGHGGLRDLWNCREVVLAREE